MRLLVAVLILVNAGRASADRRVVWLFNVHTKEEIRLQPFGRLGIPDRLAWARLTRFFRSRGTGKRRTIHPRLLRALAQVQRHFGGRRLELVSGYRVPGDGHELDSYHHVGRAADVRIDGVADRALFEYCRTLGRVGCGFYPHSRFVHIDVRGSPAIWVDLGGRNYVEDPQRWLDENP